MFAASCPPRSPASVPRRPVVQTAPDAPGRPRCAHRTPPERRVRPLRGPAAYVTFRHITKPETAPNPPPAPPAPPATGRPRDARIDSAVLQATAELLEEHGYL